MKFLNTFLSTFVLVVISLLLLADKSQAVGIRHALSDVNRDGVISLLDQKLVSENFGVVNPTGKLALSDINQDGIIDSADLTLVTTQKGELVSRCEMADLNGNGTVDLEDFDILSPYYAQIATSASMIADITGDGVIDILDLSKMGGSFGCTW